MQHATVFPVRPAVPKAELRALAARRDRKGLVQFGGHLALLAVTGGAVLWAEGSWGDSWALAPALLAHGIGLVLLFAKPEARLLGNGGGRTGRYQGLLNQTKTKKQKH